MVLRSDNRTHWTHNSAEEQAQVFRDILEDKALDLEKIHQQMDGGPLKVLEVPFEARKYSRWYIFLVSYVVCRHVVPYGVKWKRFKSYEITGC